MILHAFLSLLLLGSPALVDACQSKIEKPPLLWLADLRSGNVDVDSTVTLSKAGPGLRLIRFEEGAVPIPITPLEKTELEKTGLRYFDVTDDDLEAVVSQRVANGLYASSRAIPTNPTQQTTVRAVIATLSQSNLRTDLAALTSYRTRYYRSTAGATAARDLARKLQTIAAAAPGNGPRVSVSSFTHTWGMNSVIARIQGTNSTGPITIAGAHLDSLNQANPTSGDAPGADDDGSGCVNLIEAFRKLVASRFKPTNPIEFHWYSGEEGGLLGSAAIATSYTNAGRPINAYLNLDMTAWRQTGTTAQIGFVSDRTNSNLTAFTKKLVSTYLTGVVATDDHCGYACSDHASWNSLGYPAVYPFESITENMNPNIHTAADTTNYTQFSFAHMHEFTKLVVAYMIELSV